MSYKIEKGIKLPIKTNALYDYPFEDMAIGDSFFVPKNKAKALYQTQAFIHSYARKWKMLNDDRVDIKFTVKQVKDGCRCWRLR